MFPCLQKCLPRPGPYIVGWISTESLAGCSSCQDSGLNQKAMQVGSGVGCYSLTDCALLARFETLSSPRRSSSSAKKKRDRMSPHQPHPSSPASPNPQDCRGAAETAAGGEARGSRFMPSSADGRSRTDEMDGFASSLPRNPQHMVICDSPPLVCNGGGGKGAGDGGGDSRTSHCLGKPDWTQEETPPELRKFPSEDGV
jgi:hypothetical protein